MYTLISIFYISILAMAVMLLLKRREVMTGKCSVVSEIGAGSDHIFQAVYGYAKRGIGYLNRHSLALVANWVAFHVLKGIRYVYVEIKSQTLANPHGKRLIDAVRGRGEVKNHGASFYLRRISADHPVGK